MMKNKIKISLLHSMLFFALLIAVGSYAEVDPALVQDFKNKMESAPNNKIEFTTEGIFTPNYFESFCKALEENHSLQELVLRFSSQRGPQKFEMGDTEAGFLAQALKVNKNLKKLYVSSPYVTDIGISEILEALKQNSLLEDLTLYFKGSGNKGNIALADFLKSNTTLEKLGIMFPPSAAISLAEALKANSTLKELNLESNRLGDEEASALAQGLKVNKGLKVLNLTFNSISDEGAKELAEALKDNKELIQLILYNNKISDEGAKELAEALRVNMSIQRLPLHNQKDSIEIARDIIENIGTQVALNKEIARISQKLLKNPLLWEKVKSMLEGTAQSVDQSENPIISIVPKEIIVEILKLVMKLEMQDLGISS
jgi:Ran GTPase-activating protein (RanGAP) involved in mRNA processing and transport